MIDDRPLLTRVLLWIWFAGTSTFTLSLLIAPPAEPNWTALWIVSGVGYAMTLCLWLLRRKLPEYAADASGYLCCALATVVTAASNDLTTPFCLFYFWVTVVSCHFLPVRRAIPQMLVVTPCYAVALVLIDASAFPWFQWALLSLTVLVVGASVTAMRARLAALVGVLADTASTDALTGLRNRRAFEATLAVELERTAGTGDTLALIIGDLDHFKAINDEFGHQSGDEVLQGTARAIESVVRRVEMPFRIGGEEFAVIVPATDLASAHLLAERIREAVARSFADDQRVVTMSLGIAAYPEHGPDAVSLFAHADGACYQAKQRGRNRSVSAAKAMWPATSLPTQRSIQVAR